MSTATFATAFLWPLARRLQWRRPATKAAAMASAAQRSVGTTLRKGALLSITQPLGCRVECVRGSVWITHDNEHRDTILAAGQGHVAQVRQRMIVQGLEMSAVRIEMPHAQA